MSLEKKITINLLNQLSINENVVDDFLDQEMQAIDNLYGGSYDGLSTKVLSLFAQNGKRLQVIEEEFVHELVEKRGLDKNIAHQILDRLQEADLITCTNDNRYELANNTLVQRVEKKVEAESSLLRNMRVVIRDHMSRNELLDRQYLDHIAPFMTRLELEEEQKYFVNRSHKSIRRARQRRQLLALLGVLLLLGFSAVTSFLAWKSNENYKEAENQKVVAEAKSQELTVSNANLAKTTKELDETNAILSRQNQDKQILINQIDSALDVALAARIAAENAQDSIERVNNSLGKARNDLQAALKREANLRKIADGDREEAVDARKDALRGKRQSDLLAISLNAAVRSQSVTDPKLQSLIARQSYRLYKDYVINSDNDLDPDANHPYIFTALRKSLQNLVPEIRLSTKAHNGSINDILISPDGKKMYTASSDGTVKEWSIAYWRAMGSPDMEPTVLSGLKSNVVYENISLSKNRGHLLISGQLDYMQLFNFGTNYVQEKLFLEGFGGRNSTVYASSLIDPQDPTQSIVMMRNKFQTSQMLTKSIRVRDYGDPAVKLDTRANTVLEVNGKILGLAAKTSYGDGRVYIDLQVMDRLVQPAKRINYELEVDGKKYGDAVTLAAQQKGDNGIVAIGLENGHLIVGKVDLMGDDIWKNDLGGLLTFKTHQAAISDIVFSQNGNYMAVASYDGTISIWDLRYFLEATYQPLVISDHRDWVRSLSFANNDRMLVAGTKDGRLYFWNFHSPDYAQAICDRLSAQSPYPNYDRIDDQIWNQFFGDNIEKDDQICR